jgi:predicted polyphosphate/ATP-dependent NAD kinase
MRILVTGGRDYRDQRRVDEALDTIHGETPIELVIHGDASGADRMAADWARRRQVPLSSYPADWGNIDRPGARIRFKGRRPYDATAGFRRNIRMLIEGAPQLVVAFPGGNGTAHMVAESLKRNFAVLSVDP